MQQLFSLKNDFYEKIFGNFEKELFKTDELSISGYQALNYYLKIKRNIGKEVKTVSIICNQSIENLIICFFLILSQYEILLLSNDQNQKDIVESLEKNKCNFLIAEEGYDLQSKNIKSNLKIYNYCLIKNCLLSNLNDIKNLKETFLDSEIGRTIFMSSGSTAKPKFIPLSYTNINTCYENVLLGFLKRLDFNQIICVHDPSFVIVLPFLFSFASNKNSKVYGLERSKIKLSLLSATNEILKKKVKNLIISVPSVYKSILKILQNKDEVDLNNTNIITCGEPLDKNLALKISGKNPLSFFNLYGSTEVSPWIIYLNINDYLRENKENISSIIPAGKSLPNTDLLIHEDQELIVNSSAVFDGYLHFKENQPFLNFNNKKYFRTGDKFSLENKLFFCEGRLSGAIKVAGRFINPIIIEAALRCELEISEVLLIPDQNSPKVIINIFSFHLENKDNAENIIRGVINEYVSNKIDSKIKFYPEEARKLRSGKIDRKFYQDRME